jgi:hypothetical protein
VLAHEALLLEVRVQLDLVDRRHLAGGLHDAPQVLRLEVRRTDRADEPLVAQLDQRLPGLDVAVPGRHGPVDEVEVDVVELEPLEAALEGVARLLTTVVVVEALGRDEDLLASSPDARIAWGKP